MRDGEPAVGERRVPRLVRRPRCAPSRIAARPPRAAASRHAARHVCARPTARTTLARLVVATTTRSSAQAGRVVTRQYRSTVYRWVERTGARHHATTASAQLRARIGDRAAAPAAAALPRTRTRTRSATSPRPTATTTRCGAIPTTRHDTRWGGPIAPPHLVGGDTLIGENEVRASSTTTRRRCCGATRSGGAHAFYAGQLPRVVGAAAAGHAGDAPQRARRRARQAAASSPSGRCTSGRPRCSRPRSGRGAVGAVPADDPHRPRRRRRSAASTTTTVIEPYTDERARRDRRGVRGRARPPARRRAALVGGRAARATRSARS